MLQDRRDYARIALGLIRLANGVLALAAPAFLLRRLAVDPKAEAAASYPFRMFGIRTILIGADLLMNRPQALRVAPIIHISDVASAAIAGVRGELPRRAAVTTAVISTINVVLAFAAQPQAGHPSASVVSTPPKQTSKLQFRRLSAAPTARPSD